MINIGYACKISGYKDYSLRTCRLSSASFEKLEEIVKWNLNTLLSILEYNKTVKINLFRISSDIIPLGSHPENSYPWHIIFEDTLREIGEYIKKNSFRVSMHPGQYTILNSPNKDVVERSILDLKYHTKFLDSLGLPPSHKIILHIGGAYENKAASLERFIETAKNLPLDILSRLVIENDDKIFNIDDVLYACSKLKIPGVFDVLHHSCNPADGSIEYYINSCKATWKETDGKQKIHYSQQNKNGKTGSHSLTIDIDEWVNDSKLFKDVDVMLEVKDKNLSAIKCNYITNGCKRQDLEVSWGNYKYLVMSHSQKHYELLRKLFREEISAYDFFKIVDEAMNIPLCKKYVVNAAEHIWGYFKKLEPSDKYISLLNGYKNGTVSKNALYNYLYRQAKKHNTSYLLNGYSFYEN